ncbi:MAG: N-acetylneuraminate synthase family protein [Treponema sp.]|jgi:sialic acid synthase SpsE|nr:N-acetylneuraminate synthase family protein [Treponema sp.]
MNTNIDQGFTIADKTYTARQVLTIAELGTSHGADPVKARELIDAAAEAGADCIKFQMVYADEILHPNTGEVALPGGAIRLYERFKQLEVDPDFFADMKAYVESRGLLFLCTPFGIRSAREVRALKPQVIKIASPELNHTKLLREIVSYQTPVFLSTGVSKLGDIEAALGILATESVPVCLLHCVTSYPAPVTEYNLRILTSLAAVFGLPVGLSDHSLDPELVPVLGIAMGACAVEKHFCLSRRDSGLDDPIALPPADFERMVRAIRQASTRDPEALIEAVSQERGAALVQTILGDGVKRLAPSEAAYYERTNRSLHALRDIQEGERITADMVAALRTEKLLRPGLPPSWETKIIGRISRAFIPAGEGIRFEDI